MSKKTLYPVHEMFHTWQGEGVHMGQSAFFVRLFGCPVHCPWCDSAGTWHKNYVPKDIKKMSASDIIVEATSSDYHPRFIVITGGEPAVHDLTNIVTAAGAMSIHLETSGGFDLNEALIDWITVSPKKWHPPIREVVRRADEFKFIIEHPEDIEFYTDMILEKGAVFNDGVDSEEVPIWLHPEWSKREDPTVLSAISEAVKKTSFPYYRAGWQLHKLYKVDGLDARSRPLVPLGGDPKKGY